VVVLTVMVAVVVLRVVAMVVIGAAVDGVMLALHIFRLWRRFRVMMVVRCMIAGVVATDSGRGGGGGG